MLPRQKTPAWLLLVHALPARPSHARVKTWRRLQDVGAVALKNAIWVLPHSDQAREDFEWIRTEISQMKGTAYIFASDATDNYSRDEIVAAMRVAREADYGALLKDGQALSRSRSAGTARGRAARAARIRRLAERLGRLAAITFVPPDNRDAAVEAISRLQAELTPVPRSAGGGSVLAVADFRRRRWVTRPRPGVDRMASAWLIRRFIDADARFGFADVVPAGARAVSFDMFDASFGHGEHGCTFETLVASFGLASPALARIAAIVHDVDLKDARFSPAEAPAFGPLVEGLRQAYADDGELLERGMVLFEALHRAFDQAPPPTRRARKKARRRP